MESVGLKEYLEFLLHFDIANIIQIYTPNKSKFKAFSEFSIVWFVGNEAESGNIVTLYHFHEFYSKSWYTYSHAYYSEKLKSLMGCIIT